MKTFLCVISMVLSLFFLETVIKKPNYKKCDNAILTYQNKQNDKVKIDTPSERKCSYNFYLTMKMRSYFLNDSNSSFYIYKMSTKFNSDKYYWLYISAIQGNKKAIKLLNKGSEIDWTSD